MKKILLMTCAFLFLGNLAQAADFTVSSSSFKNGEKLPSNSESKDFGCNGSNKAPNLSWKNAPSNTQSFAVTVYDPDALNGTGFWHYVAYDIPKKETSLSNLNKVPGSGVIAKNDNDKSEFTGPCPPVGSGVHHYNFTVYAIDTKKLDVPGSASTAKVVNIINQHTIDSAKITGIYERK